MSLTPHADVNRMLGLLQARIHEILGPRLIGLYLSGSLVTGDFDLLVSDIDLVAVTTGDLTPTELDRLELMHQQIARDEPTWDNRIEVAYLSTDALRTFRTQASPLAITSPGEPFHVIVAGRDWLINWYVVREYGSTLHGPPAATLIDPISQDELIQGVREQAESWREWIGRISRSEHRNGQVYATLTLCRALYTVTTGGYVSKRKSARWAARELPEWAPFIEAALRSWREDWYNAQVDHQATVPETVRFVNFVVDRIAALE